MRNFLTYLLCLSGIHIGEGAVIGSCALVTKDIPAWTIATGVPAKVVRNVENKIMPKSNGNL